MSKLRPGTYQVMITGPQGVLLSMSLNMETRGQFALSLDDEYLPELLVLNSIPQGIIERELHLARASSAEASEHTEGGGA